MYRLTEQQLGVLKQGVTWYRRACKDPRSKVLPHPEKDRWKSWDDNRIWCSVFFCIGVKGSSKIARDYLEPIEDGHLEFELNPSLLRPLSENERMRRIWEFGRGANRLHKALGRFFSTPQNYGRANSFERSIAGAFTVLERHGLKKWFEALDRLPDDRDKARALEELPGANLKVSRDFANDIGLTDSLIALDVHLLREMRDNWNWDVPEATPSRRELYEAIEDGVRDAAARLNVTVLEIDKTIYFGRMTGEYLM